jgi:hypothetical protein
MDLNESFSLFGFVTRNEACRRRVMEEIRWVKFFPAGEAAPNSTLHVTPDQLLSLNDLKGKPVIWRSIQLIGVQFAAIRWPSTKCCPSFANMRQNCWASRSMSHGVIKPSQRIVICISPYWRISNPRARSQRAMEHTERVKECRSVPYLSSTRTA